MAWTPRKRFLSLVVLSKLRRYLAERVTLAGLVGLALFCAKLLYWLWRFLSRPS